MHVAHFSLFFSVLLNFISKDVLAIKGCVVTLASPKSLKRRVLCGDPKSPINCIPERLPESTEMLIITNQNVTQIRENDLDYVLELSTLSLTNSNLEKIHKNAFKYISQLTLLDLSGNKLTIADNSFPVELLLNLNNLQHLKLSNNPLKSIPELFLKPLSNLRRLYINDCGAVALRISNQAFKGLTQLEEIDMTNSGIDRLDKSMESDFRNMKFLRVLLLGDNPWLCDCQLRWLYFYLTQLQEIVSVRNDDKKGPRCKLPKRLENNRIPAVDERHQLRYIDFVCPAKCSRLSPKSVVMKSGTSLNITCQCFSDPIKPIIWTKNGYPVEETINKFRIIHSGKENFQSTLHIHSLQSTDSGNWSCKLEEVVKNFTVKINSNSVFNLAASLNVYIFVGLGSSLLLVSLIIVMMVIFCKRDSLCQYRSQNPMVICGYETQIRKPAGYDDDIQFTYNQQDGRFHSSFYENTMPVNSNFSLYQRSNYHDDPLSEKSRIKDNDQKQQLLINSKAPPNNDKMLNIYCGCHNYSIFNSDDEPNPDPLSDSFTCNSKTMKHYLSKRNSTLNNNTTNNSHSSKFERNFQTLPLNRSTDIEKLIPKIRQCPFHGSSATLTRIPGDKPCPVHGSTATLPSRLSSKKIEHRSGCPRHDKDNISVKSLKMEPTNHNKVQPHRSKSANKIAANHHHHQHQQQQQQPSDSSVEIVTPAGYRPCPLHGDILAAITENLSEPKKPSGVHQKSSLRKEQQPPPPLSVLSKKSSSHSKTTSSLYESNMKIPAIDCDKINRKSPIEPIKNRCDHFPVTSSSISHNLTSPVQSSLSSSPLLTSDVHGTLV